MDELISKSAVLELIHQLELSLNKEETIPTIKHRIEQMTSASNREFSVETPKGRLVVSASKPADCPDDYPGIFITLGSTLGGLLVCTEYDSANDRLQTCVYQPNEDEPIEIIQHDSPPKQKT